MSLVGIFEKFQLVSAVQIPLKLSDVPLLAEVAAHLIEDFDEHRQQGVDLALADDVGFLVDVEQNALGRDGDSLFQCCAEQLVFLRNLGQENVERGATVDDTVFQQQSQHFQKV